MGPSGTNFSVILIKIPKCSFTKMHLKISSAKWPPLCPRGDELNGYMFFKKTASTCMHHLSCGEYYECKHNFTFHEKKSARQGLKFDFFQTLFNRLLQWRRYTKSQFDMACRGKQNRFKYYIGTNKQILTRLCICELCVISHDGVKWIHFRRYWSFVKGIHRSPVNSPHTGQRRGALVFSLICAWINGGANHRDPVIWGAIAPIMTSP